MDNQSLHQVSEANPQVLEKKLGALDLFTIGFGAIIGVGWIVMIGEWINLGGGPYATALAFLVGSVFLLPISMVFGEFSAAIPKAGGAIIYTEQAFGQRASYFTGWFLTLAYIMMCPWEVVAIGQLAETLIPALKVLPLYTIQGYTIYLPTLILCILVACSILAINNIGVDQVAGVQKILVFFLLAISMIAIIVSLLRGSLQNTLPSSVSTPLNPEGSFLIGFLTVLAMTPFFYSGFDTIGQGVEEVSALSNARRIGLVSPLSVCTAAIFYVIVILAVSMAVPWYELLSMNLPAAEVFSVGLGMNFLKVIVIGGAFCGLITTLNSFFIAGARVLLSMGRAQMIPSYFAKVHPRYHTPINANYIIGILSLAGAFLGKSVLLPITNVCSFGFMLAWFMVGLSSIRIKRQQPNLKSPFAIPMWVNHIAVVTSGAMLVLLVFPGSPGALAWPLEIGIVIAWLFLGVIFYVLFDQLRSSTN